MQDLGIEGLEQIYAHHHDDETDLGEAFAEQFDSPLPDVVNADQQFTIIASDLDPMLDRIVEFLAESYRVPINAVFFRHFSDGDREYLARTWLLDPQPAGDTTQRQSRRRAGLGTAETSTACSTGPTSPTAGPWPESTGS
ncbi:MAG: hypothetical protein J4G11_10755 [Acidimicrobiia bacterium]|nr:hypothetical protein [Acidimicrobiia bacterium]